jgi:hypothetical protein
MNMKTRLNFISVSFLCISLSMAVPPVQAGKLYKWIDENGQVRYGDKIPPQYAKDSNQTLNSQGVVVETKAAAKTPEQIAEEQRLAELEKQEEDKRRERQHQDRILLDTFTNEDEMIMTRDGKIEAIEAVVRITNGRIEKTRQRLAELNRTAANMERSGKQVPEAIQQQIAESRAQIRHNKEYIQNRKTEQQAIREKFEQDIKRFRELKILEAEAEANQL